MIPDLVTFDCAQTLVDVDWEVGAFVQACCAEAGVTPSADAIANYREMFDDRYPDYCTINAQRDPSACDQFWRQLTEDWLLREGLDVTRAAALRQAANRIGFSSESILFKLFDDTLPCLNALRSQGIRLAMVSNWDYTLHLVTDLFGLTGYFELVLASLEEGVEKPDPRLFEICLNQLGVRRERTVHVGDNPIDDVEGAIAAGIRPLLINRSAPNSDGMTIRTLADIPEALEWTG